MQMIAHQVSTYATERFLDAGYLHQDVGAVAVVFDHFLQAADLAFDSTKAVAIGLFEAGIDVYCFAWFAGYGTSTVSGLGLGGAFALKNLVCGHRIYPLGLFIPLGAMFVKWLDSGGACVARNLD
jgi:hypothetical protein